MSTVVHVNSLYESVCGRSSRDYNGLESAGTGFLSVVAGVGNLPSQIAMAMQLLAATPRLGHVTAHWPLAVIASQAVLAQYGPTATSKTVEIPIEAAAILGVGVNVTLCDALEAAVGHAGRALEILTSPRVGLMYFPPGAWPGWAEPKLPDVHLNLVVCLAFINPCRSWLLIVTEVMSGDRT
jgi:hypothetical protein